ncbi:NTP transferase domain-containing protein [Streptomyces aculeolatus]|uniref:NTP transferase domain-containing protein n=1 Tax=Streptomyces aculeolatus TaxID=270689 RepID=UPI0021F214E1|nr:NTP transferase domain-containing protein [Streptomyces aculeolatus]
MEASAAGEPGAPGGGTGASYDAVVLAGGRAERLNGADKPRVSVGGTPLLDRSIEGAGRGGVRSGPRSWGPTGAIPRWGSATVRADAASGLRSPDGP